MLLLLIFFCNFITNISINNTILVKLMYSTENNIRWMFTGLIIIHLERNCLLKNLLLEILIVQNKELKVTITAP